MSERSDNLRSLIEVLAGEATAGAGEHLEPELLAEYQAGGTGPETESEVRAHLVGCRRCVQALLNLEDFARATTAAPSNVSDLATAVAFRAFEANTLSEPDRSTPAWWRTRAVALAASLVVAVLGQSAWVLHLRSVNSVLRYSLAELNAPQANPQTVFISDSLRGESATDTVTLSPEQAYVLLVIVPDLIETHGRYRVEISGDRGQVTWSDDRVELSESALRVRMPRALLPAGRYRIRVFAQAPEITKPLLDSTLRIRYQ